MLHREADNMILRDLDPDKSYTVDLFFIPHQGLTSTISNTKNITFRTLPKPKGKADSKYILPLISLSLIGIYFFKKI